MKQKFLFKRITALLLTLTMLSSIGIGTGIPVSVHASAPLNVSQDFHADSLTADPHVVAYNNVNMGNWLQGELSLPEAIYHLQPNGDIAESYVIFYAGDDYVFNAFTFRFARYHDADSGLYPFTVFESDSQNGPFTSVNATVSHSDPGWD